MSKRKLVRITTVPLSLEKLLEGQLHFMSKHFEVTAISADEARLKKYAEAEGVGYYHVNLTRKITLFKDLWATFKLYRYLRKTRPYIVHTHTPKAGIVGMLAAWLARVPNRLHTVAGLPLMEANGFKKKLLVIIEKWTYRFATKVFPNSQGLQEYILVERFTSPSKLRIIGEGSSNGIDTQFFDPTTVSEAMIKQTKATYEIPSKDLVFLFVGRLVKDKGIVELVTAFQDLQQKYQDISLVLVGPFETELDPLPNDIMEICTKHPKIVLTGFQQDVRPYFAISDVLVFPSYREGFPNVVLQAGAMGVPSIVSNINGCNEIIVDGTNGLIVPVKDTEMLQEAMEKLYLDTQIRNKMAEASRGLIMQKYEREKIWKELLRMYQAL